MFKSQTHSRSVAAQLRPWILTGLLSVLTGFLLVELGRSGAVAQPPLDEPGVCLPGQGGVIAIATQLDRDEEGIVLIDTRNRSMAVYQWESNKRRLRWLASRNFTFDLQIEDYNTEMKPAEVKKLAEQADRLTDPAR
jgi:hypothetical protein